MAGPRTCFICALNLDSQTDANNLQFDGSLHYKALSVMCQVLEIPKSDNVATWTILGQAAFCDDCMGVFRKIGAMNKMISEETVVLQAKLKRNCEDRKLRQEQEGSEPPFGPFDELRDKIVRELKSTVRMAALFKPREGRQGQGYAPSCPSPPVCEESSSLDQGQ